MDKKAILEAMGEIYCYTCHKCHKSALSQDEVHQIDLDKFLCIKCWYKTCPEHCKWAYRPTEKEIKEFESNIAEIGANGDYLPDLEEIKRRMK